jgi:maltooligosyltrehalose trehalohydrolase
MGRRKEFAAFAWQGEPPDPQDEATFQACKLDHGLRDHGKHHVLLELYQELLRLRHAMPALAQLRKDRLETQTFETSKAFYVLRWSDADEVALLFNFNDTPTTMTVPLSSGHWSTVLDSAAARWNGPGSSIPTAIPSDGEMTLDIPPIAFLILSRDQGQR